jgi:hypothetical protein
MLFSQWLYKLNLFESNATDEYSVQLQRWSTRTYILVFPVILFILSIYAALHVIGQRVEIQHPTLDLGDQIRDRYPWNVLVTILLSC